MLLGLMVSGCVLRELEEPDRNNRQESDIPTNEETVQFNITDLPETRSSISIDENRLTDVNVYAFCDGLLYSSVYSTTPSTVSMKLKTGTRYNLYAVANMGKMDPAAKEEEFIRDFTYKVQAIGELSCNPLAWSYKGYTLTGGNNSVNMDMERLVSKIHFTIDRGALQGLDITSVTLRQAASAVRPFQEGGSRAMSAAEVIDGDHASAADLEKLNTTGEGVFFYALENMQGTLLPGNADPWKKTPENIGSQGLCTYIEVCGTFKAGFFYSGNVTYRFYLGTDSTKNFDIRRNSEQFITLSMTGDGLKEISWKIDADVAIEDGFASGRISSGMHAINDLYIGECPTYEIDLKPELLEYFHNDLSGVKLSFVATEGPAQALSFGALKKNSTGKYETELRCLNAARGAIWLLDRDGTRLMCANTGVSVQKPSINLGDELNESTDHTVSRYGLDNYYLYSKINGILDLSDDYGEGIPLEAFYVFLTDKEGRNLNSKTYRFDNSLFNFHLETDIPTINKFLVCTQESLPSNTGAATYKYNPRIVNNEPASYEEMDDTYDLSLRYVTDPRFTYLFQETNFGIQQSEASYLDILPVSVILHGDSWNGALKLIVHNPSEINMEFRVGLVSKVIDYLGNSSKDPLPLHENGTIKKFILANNTYPASNDYYKYHRYVDTSTDIILNPGYDPKTPYSNDMNGIADYGPYDDRYTMDNVPTYQYEVPDINPLYMDYILNSWPGKKTKHDYFAKGVTFFYDLTIAGHQPDQYFAEKGSFQWDDSGMRPDFWADVYWDPNGYGKENMHYAETIMNCVPYGGGINLNRRIPFDDYQKIFNTTAEESVTITIYQSGNNLYAKTNGPSINVTIDMDIICYGSVYTQANKNAAAQQRSATPAKATYTYTGTLDGYGRSIDNGTIHNAVVQICNQYWPHNGWNPIAVKHMDRHARPTSVNIDMKIKTNSANDVRIVTLDNRGTWDHSFTYQSTKWKDHPDSWSGTAKMNIDGDNNHLLFMVK